VRIWLIYRVAMVLWILVRGGMQRGWTAVIGCG